MNPLRYLQYDQYEHVQQVQQAVQIRYKVRYIQYRNMILKALFKGAVCKIHISHSHFKTFLEDMEYKYVLIK